METWDAIRSRRNVRQYTEEPLPADALEHILEAGWRAPSSRNWQPWDFVVVTDRAQLERLSTVWQGGGHIARAAAAVGLVIDDFELGSRDREIALYDLGQASLQMMVAAADLGIGSGHSAVGDQDLAREILGLPPTKILKYVIDFGHPADRPLKPIRKPDRRPFDEVVHRGVW
ncbi:MAG TPA: nitroreductase family protein [Solirubrobacteraceae bacterium]|jgi:nitroreductase|nr:nitroreductase family protein [Solirubrobacteraceae bacterium]